MANRNMTYTDCRNSAEMIGVMRILLTTVLLTLSYFTCAEESTDGFDHFTTGFPLTGRHELIDCASCHLAGQFKGTPLECRNCHNGLRAQGKHIQHFPSSNFCDDCHTDTTWLGARFDHLDVRDACLSCHNNVTAVGKSPSHILSTEICEDCHNTIRFEAVTTVDHFSVIGVCSSCHNGVIATGKPADHIPTTDECNACHTTNTWRGAVDPSVTP